MLHVELCCHGGDGKPDEQVDGDFFPKQRMRRKRRDEHGADRRKVLSNVVQVFQHKGSRQPNKGIVHYEANAQEVVPAPELRRTGVPLHCGDHEGARCKQDAPEVQLQVLVMDGVVCVLQELLTIDPSERREGAVDRLEHVALCGARQGKASVSAVLELADQRPDRQQQHPSPLDRRELALHDDLEDDCRRYNLEVVEDLEAERSDFVNDYKVEVVGTEVEKGRDAGSEEVGPAEGEDGGRGVGQGLLPEEESRQPKLDQLAVEGHRQGVVCIVDAPFLGGLCYQCDAAREGHLK